MPPGFAAIAALLADPARSAMLHALLGGEALTAGELARIAGVAPPTASGHLARLVGGGLVAVHRQGRHRYHRLASEEVAAALEALGGLAALAAAASPRRPWPHGEDFRTARLCYDHLAGRVGVGLHARITGAGWLAPAPGGWGLTGEGAQRLAALGLDLEAARQARRFACDCMDWSERRPHLAGGLGRELARALLRRGWLRRTAPRGEGDPAPAPESRGSFAHGAARRGGPLRPPPPRAHAGGRAGAARGVRPRPRRVIAGRSRRVPPRRERPRGEGHPHALGAPSARETRSWSVAGLARRDGGGPHEGRTPPGRPLRRRRTVRNRFSPRPPGATAIQRRQ